MTTIDGRLTEAAPISSDGVVVIKAQDHRSLERNKADALERLAALISDTSTLTSLSIYKGWLFVLVTSLLLVGLMRRQWH